MPKRRKVPLRRAGRKAVVRRVARKAVPRRAVKPRAKVFKKSTKAREKILSKSLVRAAVVLRKKRKKDESEKLRDLRTKVIGEQLVREFQGFPKNKILARALETKHPGEILKARDRVKAVADARARQFNAALKAAKIPWNVKGLFIFDTKGRRFASFKTVPKNRKVYAFMGGARGRRTWLNDIDPSTLAPDTAPQLMPRDPVSFDWRRLAAANPELFGSVMGELVGRMKSQPSEGLVYRVPSPSGELDVFWEKAGRVFLDAAKGLADHSQWVFDVGFTVRGQPQGFRFTSEVLKSFQFLDLELKTRRLKYRNRRSAPLLREVLRAKLGDSMRRILADHGLVTTGSVRRVKRMSVNEGKPRSRWVDRKGLPWGGRDRRDASVQNITFGLRRVF